MIKTSLTKSCKPVRAELVSGNLAGFRSEVADFLNSFYAFLAKDFDPKKMEEIEKDKSKKGSPLQKRSQWAYERSLIFLENERTTLFEKVKKNSRLTLVRCMAAKVINSVVQSFEKISAKIADLEADAKTLKESGPTESWQKKHKSALRKHHTNESNCAEWVDAIIADKIANAKEVLRQPRNMRPTVIFGQNSLFNWSFDGKKWINGNDSVKFGKNEVWLKLRTFDEIDLILQLFPTDYDRKFFKKKAAGNPTVNFDSDGKISVNVAFDWATKSAREGIEYDGDEVIVGLDLGISKFAAVSNGLFFDMPEVDRAYARNDRRRSRLQLASDLLGSKRARKVLATDSFSLRRGRMTEYKLRKCAKDICETLRKKYYKKNKITLVSENLTGMTASLLKRKFKDQSRGYYAKNKGAARIKKLNMRMPFFKFAEYLEQYCNENGIEYRTVHPYMTSQIDSRGLEGGKRNPENFREFIGADSVVIDADLNAATNIALKWAINKAKDADVATATREGSSMCRKVRDVAFGGGSRVLPAFSKLKFKNSEKTEENA